MSRVAAWPVSSFSLLSSSRLAEPEESAKPKLVAGVAIQPCTSDVTSNVTYWPAAEAMKIPVAAPMAGMDASVTDDSLQAEVTDERVTDPAALTRFTKSVSVACEIWLAVVPAGSVLRSNCNRAVLPLPTYRFERVPKFVAGRAVLMLASPIKATCVAWAVAVAARMVNTMESR
jgi:hypothetical protein